MEKERSSLIGGKKVDDLYSYNLHEHKGKTLYS